MALDVFIRPDLPGTSLASASAGLPWRVHRSGLRRRVTQLVYDNAETGVALTVDDDEQSSGAASVSRFVAALNVMRPDYYGREAVAALDHLVEVAGGRLVLPDPGVETGAPEGTDVGVVDATSDDVLSQWRWLNAAAWTVAERQAPSQVARTSRAAADAFWTWQVGLTDRREELSEVCWVPQLMWLRSRPSGRAQRVAVWTGGQAQALPEADLVLCMPPPSRAKAQPVVVPHREVVATIEDLLSVVETSDGSRVAYVPIELDDECKQRARALLAGRSPADLDHYEPVDLLRDDEDS